MPNWTGNNLTIIGTVEDINLFEADRVAALKANDCDMEQIITFHMVLPMPQELKGTHGVPRPMREAEIRRMAAQYEWSDEALELTTTEWVLPLTLPARVFFRVLAD